jgi:hypothetical protein
MSDFDVTAATSTDSVLEYWRTYYTWRLTYKAHDNCFDELRAAVLVHCERDELTASQRQSLLDLAAIIRNEQQAVTEQAA